MDYNTRTPRLSASRFVGFGWAIAITLIVGTVFVAVERSAHPRQSPNWRTDLKSAQQEAKSEGKLLMVEVGAAWCPPCRQMDRETWSDTEVIAQTSEMVCVRLDADADAAELKPLGVAILPTMVVFSSEGEPVLRKTGFIPAQVLKSLLASARKRTEPR